MALVCGALPLVLGTSVFVFWLFTGWTIFEIAGAMVLVCGPIVFLLGICFLLGYLLTTYANGRKPAWLAVVVAAIVLLSNFPAAAAIIMAVGHIESRYTVTIRNASQEPFTDVRLAGGGLDESLGTIAPGQTATRDLWFAADGRLDLTARLGNAPVSAAVEGYVTPGMGGRAEVIVESADTVRVSTRSKDD
jgi:hypothetical protein